MVYPHLNGFFAKLRAEEMWDLEKEVLLGREGRIGLVICMKIIHIMIGIQVGRSKEEEYNIYLCLLMLVCCVLCLYVLAFM